MNHNTSVSVPQRDWTNDNSALYSTTTFNNNIPARWSGCV